jgi:tetratricopeptide (TPR) repeat protein
MQTLLITGTDAKTFIQRQASRNDGYMAFLTPQSQIVALAYYKEPYIITANAEKLKAHLEKFVIVDDVEITRHPEESERSEGDVRIHFETYSEGDTLIKLAEKYPEKKLLEKYVSFTKGCFPGQEALAKYKNIGLQKREERSQSYLDEALEIFAKADAKDPAQLDPAIELLRKALKENSRNEDAIESLGVMLAKQGKYQEAIMVMHQLEMINPENQMAQMNLSIFYMKIGDKETAEEHKAKGTVIAFGKALQ